VRVSRVYELSELGVVLRSFALEAVRVSDGRTA
jgi:hypothetical protein